LNEPLALVELARSELSALNIRADFRSPSLSIHHSKFTIEAQRSQLLGKENNGNF